jgi:predicted DNA binding CopG/RHH family protein
MPRNTKLLISLTKEEAERIKEKAKKSGMKVSCYIRFICLSSKIKIEN